MLSKVLKHSLFSEEFRAFCRLAESFVASIVCINRLSKKDMVYRRWAGGER